MRTVIWTIVQEVGRSELDSVADQLELRDAIKTAVNRRLKSGRIEEVYFDSFVLE